ncbi:MAG: NAD-dependent epimerase/dehydratase family protein [Planctomycetota bacterium]
MRILVTGAAGQVGTDLLPLLVDRGDRVTVLDVAPRPATCPDSVTWIRGDVTLEADVFDAVKASCPDVIHHLAAILSARGETMPHQTWRVNLEGTRHVLEAARVLEAGQVFYPSTIAAFGPGPPDLVPNEVSMRPTTMYGVTKVAGELLGEYYQQRFGLDFRGVRFPGLINAGIPGGGTSDYALFMFVEGLRKGEYAAFCEPRAKIPFMYMPDALRAILELAAAPKERLTRSIYNIAAVSPTAEEFAEAARARIPGVRITFEPVEELQAILDSWPRALDDTPARNDWGWRHEYDLDRMSDDLVARMKILLAEAAAPAGA